MSGCGVSLSPILWSWNGSVSDENGRERGRKHDPTPGTVAHLCEEILALARPCSKQDQQLVRVVEGASSERTEVARPGAVVVLKPCERALGRALDPL